MDLWNQGCELRYQVSSLKPSFRCGNTNSAQLLYRTRLENTRAGTGVPVTLRADIGLFFKPFIEMDKKAATRQMVNAGKMEFGRIKQGPPSIRWALFYIIVYV